MDNRPVFVLLTATTCPACVNFKHKTWPSLKKSLEKEGRVQIVTIEVPTPQTKPSPTEYHKDLGRFIGWFPTVSLFPADRWYNKSSDLIGIVKNGRIVPPGKDKDGVYRKERVVPVGKINLSASDIMNWVNYTLDKPDGMFARSSNNNSSSSVNGSSSVNESSESNKIGANSNIMVTKDGRFMIPTASYYARFKPSKVE